MLLSRRRSRSAVLPWALFFRECEIRPQTGKGGGKTATKPGLHSRRFDNSFAECMCKKAIEYKYDECHSHESSAQQKKLEKRFRRTRLNKLWKESQEEDGQFRIENVEQERLYNQTDGRVRGGIFVNGESRLVAPSGVGDVEQIGNARVLQGLKSERACVHDCGQTQNRGHEVGEYPCRASERGEDACLSALGKTGGDSVDDPCAGNKHHD